ncbi:hypothetical protein QBC47DRAFT_213081 [Echria macrotheca]|uniref:U6 snRNA phosphodiesterase n=1 Tax=Echria macrotheca TaxID=438768 RepID=A0AAJ0BCE9_9PEZI|nr:hypothetical protein QBC47DRAFT_213081 [Echria macrotheca]
MALVDYSSDSSSDSEDDTSPTTKDNNPSENGPVATNHPPASASTISVPVPGSVPDPPAASTRLPLPPLPSSFHDLYASTVRTAPTDDPALHQGRTRQTPHIAGNWPTHIYIEWHPSSSTHQTLTSFVSALQSRLSQKNITTLHSFLTSDLNVPLPLHISLSRPIVLTTPTKDSFLTHLRNSISSLQRIKPFSLVVSGVEWHRTAESGRSFLVLRVSSASSSSSHENEELRTLLDRCNDVVAEYSQPRLYQWADGDKGRVARAFHVSVAWAFEEVTDEVRRATEEVVVKDGFGDEGGIMGTTRILVEGVKVKIGNVVTNIPLGKERVKGQGGLFGSGLGLGLRE